MKIAFITNKPYNACETFIKLQIDNLPFTLTHFYGFHHPLRIDGKKYELSKNVLSILVQKFIKKSSPEELTYQLLKEGNYDLVFTHYGTVGTLLTDICKRLQIPLVVHFYGYDAVRYSVIKKYSLSYLDMFSYATFIFSVSHVMTNKLIALGCSPDKIVYNPCSPNPMFSSVVPTYSKRQIIAIGRFVEKKAPELLIKAFARVLKIHTDIILLFAGEGPLLNQCKELVKELNITSQVKFLGTINQEDSLKYLSESQIFVQHSITASDGDMEGTPVAILEASAAGLPVVSTLHAGIPDVIRNGETGYLVEEQDIDAMATKIIKLLSDSTLITKMGAAGKLFVNKNFSSQQYLQTLENTILSAVVNHKS